MPEELIAESNSFAETDNAEILAARAAYDALYRQYKDETDAEAERVKAAGGLFIIGTERHESRRIDNQLRGRAGRQGDPGETRFYLSMEDDVMRLFGSEKMIAMMDTLRIDEDTPIDQKVLSGAIENAQKKVESRNYQARKNTLEYDDVMNVQRTTIYDQRRRVLDGEDLQTSIQNMLRTFVETTVRSELGQGGYIADRAQLDRILSKFEGLYFAHGAYTATDDELNELDSETLIEKLMELSLATYARKEAEYGAPIMRELERVIMLRVVDEYWMDNIDAMSDLRQGIVLRAYGQADPVVEYKREGYEMFEAMIAAIQEETVRRLFAVRIQSPEEVKREKVAKVTSEGGGGDKTVKRQPTVKKIKIGRNDPCPCGSGKKYKNCCLDKDLNAQ
jgi:preprotein translocase subunit SecA